MSVAAPRDVVGWVSGLPVTCEEVEAFLERHPPPPAVGLDRQVALRWAAKTVAAGRFARQEALARGLGTLSALEAAVTCELLGDGCPEASAVFAYYSRNLHLYRVPERRRVRHVLCGTRLGAAAVAARVAAGECLGDLAEECSADEGSRRARGDLGWLGRGELQGDVEQTVFAARVGEVAGPVRSPFGWHVLVVEAVQNEHVASFESVQGTITAELARFRRQAAYRAWVESRMLAEISMAPGYDHPCRPAAGDRAHRH